MDRLISLQAAIDALIKADYEFTGILSEPRARRFEQTINALPSAQPEPDWTEIMVICDNCGHAVHAKRENCKVSAQPDRPDHGYMWICPECGLMVHGDFEKCVRCGWCRQPETVARDIANILENEQDMRVILKNAEDETVVTHCDVKENAELIAQIMDCDVDGEAFLTRCRDCKYSDWYKTIDGLSFCYCMKHGSHGNGENDFCSRAERRTDGSD